MNFSVKTDTVPRIPSMNCLCNVLCFETIIFFTNELRFSVAVNGQLVLEAVVYLTSYFQVLAFNYYHFNTISSREYTLYCVL